MSGSLRDVTANADSRPYWDAAAKGRLTFKKCLSCGHVQFPPRHLCPVCWSDRLEWIEHPGRGRIHSFTIVHRAPAPGFDVPYVLAVIDLDGGPRMMSNIVGPDAVKAAIGDAVEVTFERRGGAALPQFQRAGARP
jgi:uncharacterized OB-fold protein